jgi:DNA mismatch repair ATPase MutS
LAGGGDLSAGRPGEWSLLTQARYDHLLRTRFRAGLERVRTVLSELDVYIAVGNQARVNGWGYATALPAAENILRIGGLKHPAVGNAVGNDIVLDKDTNMLFLTGANMAGKSTFMKAFGLCLYLAHMGFPVAAVEMTFSVRDGLFSSINVADDLSQGHSHFYAEVLRVKGVAQAVASGQRLVVLFDELFKGTNVKDAYDGTLSVTEAFSKYRRCAFVISTHIVEAGEELRKRRDNLRFAYLPTILENGRPSYPYILREGIAADRVGMMIIENEKIIDIITQD